MSYMNENFAGGQIVELDIAHIDEVSGGFIPVAIGVGAVVKAAVTSTTAKVIYVAAAGAVAAAVGYENNRV